ncbi:MAG: sulfatase-like hydrolase/transferase [Tissierellia bacterium]|nr:sulfatase-like hydrolase/transferase [Tissierellia bacterium]
MLFTVLLLLKILLFMNLTKVKYNGPIIFTISSLIILFLFSIIYFSKIRRKGIAAFVFYCIISTIMFVDVMYYTYFNSLPSVVMLKQFNQLGAVGDSIKDILTFRNILFILDIPFIILYLYKRRSKLVETKKYNKYISWGIPWALALALASIMVFLIRVDLFGPVTNQEIFTYHAKDIKRAILGEEEVAEGVAIFTQEDLEELLERSKLKEGKYTGIGKGKNLIVIQVEALQNFVINHFYYGQEITPNLNRLIREQGSIYFDNYFQLIGRGNTSDAEFVTNNSLYPSMEEPTYEQYEKNTFYGLPWILRDNGYTAWAFHGYEKDFWNRDRAYVNQGFQRYVNQDDFDIGETIGFGIVDKDFFNQSIDYLKELDSIDPNPFYAFMITLTSHNPFKMPEKYQVLDIREEHKETILGRYLQSIHYADEALGEFLDRLKEEGLYEDTVIAIYGDHFGITGVYGPVQEIMTDYLGYPYDIDEMMRVPLIIHVPGKDINERISKVGSQLDFLPTILNIMGIQNEKGIMFGRDLINYEGESLVAPQTYALKGSVITDQVFLEMSRDGIYQNSRAFRLDNREPVDPSECRQAYERAIAEINKSDFILKRNLLKDIIEGNGKIDPGKLLASQLELDKLIKETDSTLESLSQAYEEGYKAMTIDLSLDEDGEVIVGDNIPFGDFVRWSDDHKGFYLITRAQEDYKEIYSTILNRYNVIQDRLIPEIQEFDEYITLSFRKYYNMILNVEKMDYTHEQILEFIERHSLFALAMDGDRANTDLVKKARQKGTLTYVLDINDSKARKKLEKNQVYGFYE